MMPDPDSFLFTVEFPAAVFVGLSRYAEEYGISRGEVIVRAVSTYLVEGQRITDEINADPAEVQRLRQAREREAMPDVGLTDEQKAKLPSKPTCVHCGGWHARACPRVREIEFYQTRGELQRVRFWKKFPDDHIIWPDEPDDDSA